MPNGHEGIQAYRFNERRRAIFLTELRNGQTVRAACARAGIDEATAYRHMQDDATFKDAVTRARDEAEAKLLDSITKAAHTGETITTAGGAVVTKPGDWRAGAWMLEHHPHTKERYATITKAQVGGDPSNPAPVQVGMTVDLGPATIERLGQVVSILARAGVVRLPSGDDGGLTIVDGRSVEALDSTDESESPA